MDAIEMHGHMHFVTGLSFSPVFMHSRAKSAVSC